MVQVSTEENTHDDASNSFPLSNLQQAYLFGAQHAFDLHVATHTYYEFQQRNLDLAALEKAFNRLIAAYDVLRMKLVGEGQMRILDQVAHYPIALTDLSQADDLHCQQYLAQVRARFERTDVNFYAWPYFALQVTRLPGKIDHVHFNFSPMFIDGRSLSRLFHELSVLYKNPAAVCHPEPFSYAAYARRREQAQASPAYAKAKAYWWERLPTLPYGPELPLAQGRAQPMRSNLVRRRVLIEAPVWQALKTRASDLKLGLTPLLLTLFGASIAHWSKSKHFSLTMLIQNRDRDLPGCEDAVASFTSTVLIEMDFREPLTLVEQVKALQKRMFLDFMHIQVCGLEVLQQRNREQHSMARANSPVAFVSNLELKPGTNWSDDCFHRNGRHLVRSNLETPQIGLDHQIAETQDGELALNWDAMDEYFYPGVTQAILEAYRATIITYAQQPQRWAEPLRIATPKAQTQIIEAANQTQQGYAQSLLHSLFHARAATQPAAPAVLSGACTLDYGQLQQTCAYWSQQLLQAGVEANQLVAVFMHKGWEQVVATLAVTSAGAAYVPIDPALPEQRIRYLLERCDITQVMTQAAHATRPEIEHLRRLVVDAAPVPLPQVDVAANTVRNTSDQDLAYIIFTSGSTGQPKGVVLNHQGPVNTVLDVNATFGIGASDRVFAISALSFDLSVFDVFGLMAAGGAIVMPDPARIRDPAHWLDVMQLHQVSVWNSAPALMQMLVEYCRETERKLPSSLRVVMLSGDWIPTWLPTAIHQDIPNAKIYSLGGATEASIWSIYYPITAVESSWLSIPYGKPLARQTMHVLDAQLNPRPIGVTGDLYIGGIGLAQGYWKAPEITQRAFIQHPSSGERLYRTGDLGRYLQDGNIEFLGREDAQIKLQGYRVELGEIESVLQQHPEITHAVVIVHGEQAANRRLVAYVATGNSRLGKESLAAHAGKFLPPYMVPATYIVLDKMPVTSNGKVDRKSLPSPEPVAQSAQDARAPETATERKLAQIWQQILNVPLEAISATTSFFDLGGQSFLSVRMMAKIKQQFQIELPLAILIQADTIAVLAEKIEAHQQGLLDGVGNAPSALVLLREHTPALAPPLHLIHPVGGNVLCYRGLVAELKVLPRSYYGLQSFAALQERTAAYTLESIATRYITALKTAQPQGPYDLAGWSMGGVIAVEMARQLLAAGEHVNHLLLLDAPAPLDHVMPDTSACIRWFFRDLHGTDALWMDDYLEDIEQQNKDIQWSAVLDHVLAHGLVPDGTTREDLDAVFTMFVMNLRALRQYQPKSLKGVGRVLIARADQQPIDELKQHVAANDPAWGWREWIQQPLEVCTIAGDHYTIFAPQHLPALGQKLVQWLKDI